MYILESRCRQGRQSKSGKGRCAEATTLRRSAQAGEDTAPVRRGHRKASSRANWHSHAQWHAHPHHLLLRVHLPQPNRLLRRKLWLVRLEGGTGGATDSHPPISPPYPCQHLAPRRQGARSHPRLTQVRDRPRRPRPQRAEQRSTRPQRRTPSSSRASGCVGLCVSHASPALPGGAAGLSQSSSISTSPTVPLPLSFENECV